MAMAGQGFNAQPPPRPSSHNAHGGGGGGNPGNQLYVGNVSFESLVSSYISLISTFTCSCPIKQDGKTLKTFSVLPAISSAPISILGRMAVLKVLVR